jgi:hypothetical protein
MKTRKPWLKFLSLTFVLFMLIVVSAQSDTRHAHPTVTLHLQRATAIRILNVGLDRDGRDEIVGALKGERQAGKLEAVIITAEDAAEWTERLRDGQAVDPLLAKRLEGAFALALGSFVEPDKRWTFSE